MPVPAVDADKRGDAYKKVKPVDGIDEQGLVPDPQVMHVLFARLMAILGPLGILPIIFAVNSVTTAVNFAAASMGAREDFEPAPAALDSITANQRRLFMDAEYVAGASVKDHIDLLERTQNGDLRLPPEAARAS